MGRRGVQDSLAVERQRLLPRRRRRLRRLSQLPGGLGARAGRMAAKEGADTRRLGPPPHNPALRSGRRICARIRQRQPRMREFRSLPALLRRRHGLRTSRTGDRSHGVGRPRIAVRRTRKIREKTLHRRLVLGQPHCRHLAGRLPAELSGGLHSRHLHRPGRGRRQALRRADDPQHDRQAAARRAQRRRTPLAQRRRHFGAVISRPGMAPRRRSGLGLSRAARNARTGRKQSDAARRSGRTAGEMVARQSRAVRHDRLHAGQEGNRRQGLHALRLAAVPTQRHTVLPQRRSDRAEGRFVALHGHSADDAAVRLLVVPHAQGRQCQRRTPACAGFPAFLSGYGRRNGYLRAGRNRHVVERRRSQGRCRSLLAGMPRPCQRHGPARPQPPLGIRLERLQRDAGRHQARSPRPRTDRRTQHRRDQRMGAHHP